MTATFKLSEGSAAPVLARMWWAVMLRALLAIVFAFLAFFWWGTSLATMTMLFAGYAVADGILSLIAAFRGGGPSARNGLALAGVVSIAAGAAAMWPGLTTPTLLLIVGVWAVLRGGLEVASALTLRKVMQRDWSLAMIGGLSVAFGIMLVIAPTMQLSTFVRLFSCYALIVGLMMVLLAFRFRKAPRP